MPRRKKTRAKKPKSPADDWEDDFKTLIPVQVHLSDPLMADDFVPRRQLVLTFSTDQMFDVALAEGRKRSEVLKDSILSALEETLDKYFDGKSVR